MKILDSDHCVAVLRGQLDLRQQVTPADDLAVTCVSVGELAHGAHKSSRPAENLARLDVLLAGLIMLPFDAAAAQQFGRLKAWLERQGTPLSDLDLQIASIALTHQSSLVTHNRRHFDRIPVLQLEDWLA
ncbi:MAG: type II toxin-antitoxin system VapC family toxin [Anaerolineae bacterium]|nr:type II toxin-antitoxin system VapC family toxin [Anaerolineae bacterium]